MVLRCYNTPESSSSSCYELRLDFGRTAAMHRASTLLYKFLQLSSESRFKSRRGNALTHPAATPLATFKKAEREYININESKIRAECAEREDD